MLRSGKGVALARTGNKRLNRSVRGRAVVWVLLFSLLLSLTPSAVLAQDATAGEPAESDTVVDDRADTEEAENAGGSIDEIHFGDYVLPVEDYHLPNGLRVILGRDTSAPVVAVDIWYHVGGANDPPDRSGFAHLFEHMMFEGSENIPEGEWDRLLEPIGARNNAYTAADKTAYWEVAPANELPRILWMEADRMQGLQVTESAYETQRSVVIQEYNERVANAPYGFANNRLFTQPFEGYVPYERPVIGSVEDLEAAPFEDVKAFHDRYYKPNNATLVVLGDINIEQTQALVQAYFGDIPPGEPLAPITERYPLPDEFPATGVDEETGCTLGTRETIVDPAIRVPRVAVSVVAPPRGEPDYYALDILVGILSGGNSSRMQQNLVQQGLAASAFAGLNAYVGAGVFYAAAYPNTGDSLEEMERLLEEEFAKIRTEGVAESELARVKEQILANTLTSYRESALATAEWLQDAIMIFDDPNSIERELAMYDAVTVEDVQEAAQRYLCDAPMNYQETVMDGETSLNTDVAVDAPAVESSEAVSLPVDPVVLPAAALAELPEGTVQEDDVPASLGDLSSDFPPFETFTLENGLEVIYVAQNEVPKLQLQLVVGGANTSVGPEQQGVADLMADLITKGTIWRSASTIAETIEAVGGSIRADAALEWTSISVDALTTDTALAFELLGEIARYPNFPQQEFGVAQRQTLTFLESDAVDPNSMANRQFGRVAYGGHPYGYVTTPETVESLTRDDVRAFHRTFYRPNNALLVIVGDITAEEARAQTEEAFGLWRRAEVPDYLDYPERTPADTSVIYLVERPESEQATINVGNIAINARNPDRYALQVVNSVLGSGSSSRLFRNLREDKGYTYGVYSRFAQPNDPASFRVIGDFDQTVAAASVEEILSELARIRTELIPVQELEEAKGKITGGFAVSMEDLEVYANQLANRQLTGVPIAEINEYLPRLEAVTAEEVRDAAAEYIDSESPIIVVVGNRERLLSQLQELGDVQVVDGDGNEVDVEADTEPEVEDE